MKIHLTLSTKTHAPIFDIIKIGAPVKIKYRAKKYDFTKNGKRIRGTKYVAEEIYT